MNRQDAINNETIYTAFKNYKILSFLTTITALQLISHSFKSCVLFHMATAAGIWYYLQGENSLYVFVMSSIIASVVAFLLYQLLNTRKHHPVLKIFLQLLSNGVIVVTLLSFGVFNIPALSYAFTASSLVPEMGLSYIYSYVSGCLLSVGILAIFSLGSQQFQNDEFNFV